MTSFYLNLLFKGPSPRPPVGLRELGPQRVNVNPSQHTTDIFRCKKPPYDFITIFFWNVFFLLYVNTNPKRFKRFALSLNQAEAVV